MKRLLAAATLLALAACQTQPMNDAQRQAVIGMLASGSYRTQPYYQQAYQAPVQQSHYMHCQANGGGSVDCY